MTSRVFVAGLVSAVSFAPSAASAKVFLTTDEALRLAFPGCAVERRTTFLTEEQRRRAAELAGAAIDSGLVHSYEATCEGQPGGVAYFDVHRVRTLPEALMVVVDPGDRVRRIEVLSFQEPEDYLPKPVWYAQFVGRSLAPDLALKQDIRTIAGATLTARATTEAVRRVLAIHHVIRRPESAP